MQIGRGQLKVVMADNPPRRTKAWDRGGDVVFEVDVVDSLTNRRAQHQLPRRFVVLPVAAIDRAAAGHNRRAGPIAQQPLDLDGALNEIETQFHQPDAVLGEKLVLGDHMPVASASYTHTDHRGVPVPLVGVLINS